MTDKFHVALDRLIDPHRPRLRIERTNQFDRRAHIRNNFRRLRFGVRDGARRLCPPFVLVRINAHRLVKAAKRREVPNDFVRALPNGQRRVLRHVSDTASERLRRPCVERKRHPSLYADGVCPVEVCPRAAADQIDPGLRHRLQTRLVLRQFIKPQGVQWHHFSPQKTVRIGQPHIGQQ